MGKVSTRFFVLVALLFFGGIFAWPPVADSYASGFRTLGQSVYGVRQGPSQVVFQRLKEEHAHYDTRIVLTHPESPKVRVPLPVSSYHCSYKPSVLLLALVLATSMGWKKRLAVVPLALVLSQAFVLLRLGLAIGLKYTTFQLRGDPPVDLRWIPTLAQDTLNLLLWDDLSSNYVIPISLWLLLVLPWRRSGEDGDAALVPPELDAPETLETPRP